MAGPRGCINGGLTAVVWLAGIFCTHKAIDILLQHFGHGNSHKPQTPFVPETERGDPEEIERKCLAAHQKYLTDLLSDPNSSLEADDGSSEVPVKNNTTLELLHRRRAAETKLLIGSKTHLQTLDVASKMFAHQNAFTVSNAICLGLGSFGGPVGRCACCPKTASEEVTANEEVMAQLVLFEYWIELLRERFAIPNNEIYFQDPTFNDLDRSFLAELGYTVVSSPASSSHLNEETFLFAPFMDEYPMYLTLRVCFPAVYFGAPLAIGNPWSLTSNKEFCNFVKPFLERTETVNEVSLGRRSEDENKGGAVYWPMG